MSRYVLGVSCFYHDAAAALLRDGRVVAAAQEERFSRQKHDRSFPDRSIAFCLEHEGIRSDALDYVVFYEKPLVKFERILTTNMATFPRSWRAFSEAMISWFDEKLWIRNRLEERTGLPSERVLFADHHVSHAASAFFCSPFERAALLTVDGVGEWTTTATGTARAGRDGGGEARIELDREIRYPHSLGLLYSAFTAFLGFRVNNGEYKVMGMASYGEPRFRDRVRELIRVDGDGGFRLDMAYFTFHHSAEQTFGRRFVELFGEPRAPDAAFLVPGTSAWERADEASRERSRHYADVAASVQRVTEEVLLKILRRLHDETGLDRLCMAGGVALNSAANGRIVRDGPFRHVYVQPAAGDAGGALGAALFAWRVLLGESGGAGMTDAYLGRGYGEDEIRSVLDDAGIPYTRYDDDGALTDAVAAELLQGRVVGWFQGRFEWGPRALGNRSILADPTRPEMKDVVNRTIKFREPFRPFAPVVPAEAASELFESMERVEDLHLARYMLMVAPWKDEVRDRVPAVDHLGTGRVQTVRREWNPRYYDLLKKFGAERGIPVLLNTSFNLRGEPIVSSPRDALKTFRESGLDVLAMERFVVRRREMG